MKAGVALYFAANDVVASCMSQHARSAADPLSKQAKKLTRKLLKSAEFKAPAAKGAKA